MSALDPSGLLNRITEHSLNPMLEISLPSGDITWASDSARSFLGGYDALDGRPLVDVVEDRDCRTLLHELGKAAAADRCFTTDLRVKDPAGAQRTAHINAECYDCRAGRLAMIGFSAASYQSEYYEALQRENADLKRLVSNVPCGFFSYYVDGGSVFSGVSSGLLDIFGYTEGEFRRVFNNRYFDMIYERDRDAAKLTVFEQLAGRGGSDLSYRVRRKDGTLRWLYEKGHLVVEKDGDQLFYVAVLDVTELYSAREDLKAANLELDAIAENMPSGLAVIEMGDEPRVMFGNDRFYALFGAERGANGGQTALRELIKERDFERFASECAEVAPRHGSFKIEFGLECEGRPPTWCECSSTVFRITEVGIPMVVSIFMDMTEHRNYENELLIQAERSRLVEELTNETVFEYDPLVDTLIFPNILTSSGKATVLRSFRVIVNTTDAGGNGDGSPAKALEFVLGNPEGKTVDFKTDYFGREADWYRATYRTITDKGAHTVRVLGRIRNITREREEHTQLLKRASVDSLTSLLNRMALRAEAESYLSGEGGGGSHALLVLDIDNFKMANDVYGHPFGDSVLREVARAMTASFRSSDFIGRIGGDEFIGFIKCIDRSLALGKARMLSELIARSAGSERNVRISVSIGIALFPDDAGSYLELYHKADMALYRAKRCGKNSVVFYDSSFEGHPSLPAEGP